MLALPDEFRLAVYCADIEACRAERSPKSCRPQVEPSARDYIADDAGCASCWPAPPTRTHETWPLAVCLRRRAGGFSALRCCRPGRDAVKERVTSRKRVRTLCVWRRLARVRVVCDGGFEGGCRAFESARGRYTDLRLQHQPDGRFPARRGYRARPSPAETHRPWNPLSDHRRQESPVGDKIVRRGLLPAACCIMLGDSWRIGCPLKEP